MPDFDGQAVAAADLQEPVVGPDIQPSYGPLDAFGRTVLQSSRPSCCTTAMRSMACVWPAILPFSR